LKWSEKLLVKKQKSSGKIKGRKFNRSSSKLSN